MARRLSSFSLRGYRQNSLYLSETAFHDAAISAVSSSTADDSSSSPNKDPADDKISNKNDDTEKMVQVARTFLSSASPEFLSVLDQHDDQASATDRLVKAGRNVTSTLRYAEHQQKQTDREPHDGEVDSSSLSLSNSPLSLTKMKVDATLALLADECTKLASILSSTSTTPLVPKVRFGKTELQMPIITLGCMRFQQSWNRGNAEIVDNMDKVTKECQDNLVRILKYAFSMGITHIETAKGYGSSEIQLGNALSTILQSGQVKREDLIIQTKSGVTSSMTPNDFRQQIEQQLRDLQVDYIDLFSVHGVNTDEQYDWLFHSHGDDDDDENKNNKKGNLITAVRELKAEGKIRHIGFSTHGRAELIRRIIETDEFEYVNLHHHFCGSYTASGDAIVGSDGSTNVEGNLENIRLCKEKDMGVFIISAYDKGGRVYAPSNKLRDLTLPEMEPMTYESLFLWQHHLHDEKSAPCHTISIGAARPSDLDQPIVAALMLSENEVEETSRLRDMVSARLQKARVDALGKEWVDTWYLGLPNSTYAKYGTQWGNIIWYYNLILSYGMLDFCKERYSAQESNVKKWDYTKSKEDNIKEIGVIWGWCPGCGYGSQVDYLDDLAKCPEENRERLLEAIQFVHRWCCSEKKEEGQANNANNEADEEKKTDDEIVPFEWKTAYDMRPWTAFPERS